MCLTSVLTLADLFEVVEVSERWVDEKLTDTLVESVHGVRVLIFDTLSVEYVKSTTLDA